MRDELNVDWVLSNISPSNTFKRYPSHKDARLLFVSASLTGLGKCKSDAFLKFKKHIGMKHHFT